MKLYHLSLAQSDGVALVKEKVEAQRLAVTLHPCTIVVGAESRVAHGVVVAGSEQEELRTSRALQPALTVGVS